MYEVGDKVVYQGADKSAYKRVGVLKSIEEKDGKQQLTVEFDNGETFTAPVDDWSREFTNACKNACVSTNSVVRNAIAANRRVARNGESEQREIVEMNIDSLKKDLDKVVRGLDETKRWMGKYGDNRVASIDKAKIAVVQALQQLRY